MNARAYQAAVVRVGHYTILLYYTMVAAVRDGGIVLVVLVREAGNILVACCTCLRGRHCTGAMSIVLVVLVREAGNVLVACCTCSRGRHCTGALYLCERQADRDSNCSTDTNIRITLQTRQTYNLSPNLQQAVFFLL